MLLAAYASDSDSGSDTEAPVPRASTAPVIKPALPATTKPTAPAAATAPAAVAAPKGKKRTGPIKITLDLPKAGKNKGKGSESDNEDGVQGGSDAEGAGKSDGEGGEGRGAKRVKLGGKGLKGGAGAYVASHLGCLQLWLSAVEVLWESANQP